MNSFKVSVIISNYNYASYLSAAVDSVLKQTYQNFEIIIVDDGSTDNSKEVIQEIQQQSMEKIHTIFQANQGQGGAFNTAFAASTGEIIAFLDADDVWHPQKLERIVQEFDDRDVIGVMHQLETIDGNAKPIDTGTNQPISLPDNLAQVVIKTGNAWFFPPTSALSYRRHVLAQVFPVDAVKWRLWVDGCIIYCTSFLGKVKTLNDVLGSYRIHGANNHMTTEVQAFQEEKALAGIEMTNDYINQFLKKINYQGRVSLDNNLQYQRSRYYQKGMFSLNKTYKILSLISRWPFYSTSEKLYFMARFLVKSIKMLKISSQETSEMTESYK